MSQCLQSCFTPVSEDHASSCCQGKGRAWRAGSGAHTLSLHCHTGSRLLRCAWAMGYMSCTLLGFIDTQFCLAAGRVNSLVTLGHVWDNVEVMLCVPRAQQTPAEARFSNAQRHSHITHSLPGAYGSLVSGAAAGLGREGWGRLGASSRGDGAGMLGMPVSPDTAVEAAKGSEERSVEVLRASSGSEPVSRPAMQQESATQDQLQLLQHVDLNMRSQQMMPGNFHTIHNIGMRQACIARCMQCPWNKNEQSQCGKHSNLAVAGQPVQQLQRECLRSLHCWVAHQKVRLLPHCGLALEELQVPRSAEMLWQG